MSKATVPFFLVSAVFLCVGKASGAGFGLYEMSTRAVMEGGHAIAKPVDASAVYYNPATMSGLTGTWVTVGSAFIKPGLDTRVNGVGTHAMDPGWFADPHAFITQELPWGLTAGLGFFADYGLGSHYDNSWPLSFNSVETTVEGYCVSPTLSYRITDKWSVGGGVRLERLNFEQRRIYQLDRLANYAYGANYLGRMNMKLDAHNDVDVGYVLGTTYDVTDDFSVGALWRSRIRCDVEGTSKASGTTAYSSRMAAANTADVGDKLDLPMSATAGFNWDRALWQEKLHLGASLTWTEWSSIDVFDFGLAESMELGWHNAYRTGFGMGYDVTDWWTPGVGYIYDWDPTKEKRPCTMLPAGDRHNIYFGSCFHITENIDFSLAMGLVLMESKTAWYDNPVTGQKDAFKFQTRNSHTYIVSATVSYHF